MLLEKGTFSREYIDLSYINNKTETKIGRGGSGVSQFTFALINWSNSKAASARCLQYKAVGGKLK